MDAEKVFWACLLFIGCLVGWCEKDYSVTAELDPMFHIFVI